LSFGKESTSLALRPESHFQIHALQRGKRFELHAGVLEANVARQPPFRRLILQTPNAEATVVGTRFTLMVSTNRTRLDVMEGEVRLANRGDPTIKPIKVPAENHAIVGAGNQTGGVAANQFLSPASGGPILRSAVCLICPVTPIFSGKPDGQDLSKVLELQPTTTNRFLARFRGFLHPPVTGDASSGWRARMSKAVHCRWGRIIGESSDGDDRRGHKPNTRQWDLPRFREKVPGARRSH
jgi:hypothetical protein